MSGDRTLPALQDLPSDLLDHSHTYGFVNNFEHAYKLDQELRTLNDQRHNKAGATCADMPPTDAAWQQLKNELFFAITNCSSMIEKPTNPQVKKVQGLRNVEVEVIAWKILEAIKHGQSGNIGIPGPNYHYGAFDTFHARFDAVKNAVQQSKCIVGSTLHVDFIKRLVADPDQELELKVSNKTPNTRKTTQNKAGQKVIKIDDAITDIDDSLKYRTGEQVAPAPPHPTEVEKAIKSMKASKKRRREDSVEGDKATVPCPPGKRPLSQRQ